MVSRHQRRIFAIRWTRYYQGAKILLTCIPQPDMHALEAAVARAQGRHARLLKSAGQAMGADSRLAMQELVKVDIYLTQVATTCSMAADGGISAQPPGI